MNEQNCPALASNSKFLKEIFTNIKKEEVINNAQTFEVEQIQKGRIQFELEIEEGKTEIIVANLNDSPSKIAEEFCKKASLDSKYFKPLKAKISSEMELKKKLKKQELFRTNKCSDSDLEIITFNNNVKSKINFSNEIVEIKPKNNPAEKSNEESNFTINEKFSEEGVLSSSEENIESINPNVLSLKKTALPTINSQVKLKGNGSNDVGTNLINNFSNYQVENSNDEANLPVLSSTAKTKFKIGPNDSQHLINTNSSQKSGIIITKRHTNNLHRINNIENQGIKQAYNDETKNILKDIREIKQSNKNTNQNLEGVSPNKSNPKSSFEKNKSENVIKLIKNDCENQITSNLSKKQKIQINRKLDPFNKKNYYFDNENSPEIISDRKFIKSPAIIENNQMNLLKKVDLKSIINEGIDNLQKSSEVQKNNFNPFL